MKHAHVDVNAWTNGWTVAVVTGPGPTGSRGRPKKIWHSAIVRSYPALKFLLDHAARVRTAYLAGTLNRSQKDRSARQTARRAGARSR